MAKEDDSNRDVETIDASDNVAGVVEKDNALYVDNTKLDATAKY